jgi:hypothetical protein
VRGFRKQLGSSLSGVAALTFVVAPLLHAEVHVREEQQARLERSAAFDRVFEIVFSGKSSGRRIELLRALDRVLGKAEAGAPHLHSPVEKPHQNGGDPGAARHSHGPGPHGDGTPQHFGVALRAAQAHLPLARPLLVAIALAQPGAAVFVSRTAWLVEQSQGPPRC